MLDWPDCRNVRDLGGLPTRDGVSGARGERITYVRILRSAEDADSGKTLEIG